MLILTQEARERIAAAIVESLRPDVRPFGSPSGGVNIEIGEFPFFEVTADRVRLGLWVDMSPATAEELAAAQAPKHPGAWDGVTPVDAQRFEDAPCYLCGYSGPGYFQADTHSCAAGYHAAVARLSRADPA